MNTFFYIIDVCAYNAFVLHKIKNPEFYKNDQLRARMLGLETLAMKLINPGIKARNEKFARNKYHGIQSRILNAIENAGEKLIKKVTAPLNGNPNRLEIRTRCHLCKLQGIKTDFKYIVCCTKCRSAICPDHTFNYCSSCKDELEEQ